MNQQLQDALDEVNAIAWAKGSPDDYAYLHETLGLDIVETRELVMKEWGDTLERLIIDSSIANLSVAAVAFGTNLLLAGAVYGRERK